MPSPARIRLAQRRGLPLRQAKQLAGLTTPRKIQDFLAKLPQNFEPDGDTARSVQAALTANCAHCIEGAMIAAFALWLQGHPPLLIDLSAVPFMDSAGLGALIGGIRRAREAGGDVAVACSRPRTPGNPSGHATPAHVR